MSAADVDAIQRAIAANLAAIEGLQVYPTMLASPTPPSAHVIVGPAEYHGALQDGLQTLHFTVEVYLPRTTDIGVQRTLNGYFSDEGPTSVKTALESDTKLTSRFQNDGSILAGQARLCADLTVLNRTGQGIAKLPDGSGDCVFGAWTVQVLV